MSAEASGWVYRHSPYRGATFQVHHAVADSVNDQHGNELWMAMGNVAAKARVNRKTALEAIAQMVQDGYLEVLDDHRADRAGRPSRYRFLFPDEPVIFETRGAVSGHTPTRGGAVSGHTGVRSQATRGAVSGHTNPREPKRGTQEEPSGSLFDPPSPNGHTPPPGEDPVVAVFDAWREATSRTDRTLLSPERRRLIARALADYPLDDVLDAVSGWERLAWNRGHNASGTVYNDIETLLRNAKQIERFRDAARRPREPDPASTKAKHQGITETDRRTERISAP